jgi:aryl-alcohol dehydrogenase-like predicted oxidoreductase
MDQGAVTENRTVSTIAKAHGATPRQVALAWLLARSPVMLPIPGTSSLAHLEENLAARSLTLTPNEIAALNRT